MDLQKALDIFGLKNLRDVDQRGLKQLYRQLAKEHHPDQGGEAFMFVDLKNAYTFLQNRVEVEFPKNSDISVLSKEDILNKFYQETNQLQARIESFELSFDAQSETLKQVKHRINNLAQDFERRKETLEEELEDKIRKLEKKYAGTGSLIKKLLFFLPRMNESDFWHKYQELLEQFSKKHNEIDGEFFKEMLSVYADGLNAMSQVLKKY